MKYRIVKRVYTDGTEFFAIQERFWIFPWKDLEGYASNSYWFLDFESAKIRMEALKVKKIKDIVVYK